MDLEIISITLNKIIKNQSASAQLSDEEFENRLTAHKLEHSYAGVLGKSIEPVIKPLGYDWKIGIALITSFAAREVFVGTIATIYSVGSKAEDETTIKEKLAAEINPFTGKPMYSLALGVSLMIFYAFAMQCMSTLAVVYRETKGWKWPLLQLGYMTFVAYVCGVGSLPTAEIAETSMTQHQLREVFSNRISSFQAELETLQKKDRTYGNHPRGSFCIVSCRHRHTSPTFGELRWIFAEITVFIPAFGLAIRQHNRIKFDLNHINHLN